MAGAPDPGPKPMNWAESLGPVFLLRAETGPLHDTTAWHVLAPGELEHMVRNSSD